jgi:predicted lipoprotein
MANEKTTVDALQSLTPKAEWVLRGDVLEWHDSLQTEPTTSAIAAEILRLQAIYDSQEYSRSRQQEYPSIQECIHAILDDDLTALQEKRQAVKDKYPKESK